MSLNIRVCPQCGGGQTMKVSLARTQGTSSSVFGGLSQAGGQTGVFGGAVINQTALARSLSPPKEPAKRIATSGCLAVIPLLFVMGVAIEGLTSDIKDYHKQQDARMLIFLIFIISGIFLFRWLDRREKAKLEFEYGRDITEFERACAEWERSWVCLQCGHIYRA